MEHASVPAFARLTWQLAAAGAPADLLEWAQRAGLEEIDHARRSFALAAGYGGRAHGVLAMPDLFAEGEADAGDPLTRMAVESVKDGCLLEGFNAAIAAASRDGCTDAAARDVLDRIARDEESHAELAWAVLTWLIDRGGDDVAHAAERAVARLEEVVRPSAWSGVDRSLLEKADRSAMRDHGCLDDEEWAERWRACITGVRARWAALGDRVRRERYLQSPEPT
jgi:hypothetical protein